MNKKEFIENNFENVIIEYQTFVNTIANDIKVFAGSDYSYYPRTKEIEIPYLIADRGAKQFLMSVAAANVGNLNPYSIDIFMWSILHELGHNKSKQGDIISKIGRKISHLCCKLKLMNLANKIYFNLPEEKNATEWATDYVNLHYQEIKRWEEKIQNSYNNFYENIGITIDNNLIL